MSDYSAAAPAQNAPAAHGHDGHGGHDHGLAHVMPVPILLGVFFALGFLTIVTVAVTKIDLGGLNIWIAMGIATIKALLVCVFFMHLRYDKLLNIIVFGASFLFVFLFLSVALIDRGQYQRDIERFQHNLPGIKPESGPSIAPPQGPGAAQPPAPDATAPAAPAPARH